MKRKRRVTPAQKKAQARKPSIWVKIFRFFFPKDFWGELKRGMQMGKASKAAEKLGGGLYGLGRFARRKVDPEHKIRTGERRRKKK